MTKPNSSTNHNKLHKTVSSGLVGLLGVATLAIAARETFPSGKPLPSVPGLTQMGPYQRYTVPQSELSKGIEATPVTIAGQYGEGSDSRLVSEIEEQETDGVLTPGQVVIIPARDTNQEDYQKMATQPPVAGQNIQ